MKLIFDKSKEAKERLMGYCCYKCEYFIFPQQKIRFNTFGICCKKTKDKFRRIQEYIIGGRQKSEDYCRKFKQHTECNLQELDEAYNEIKKQVDITLKAVKMNNE